MIRPKKLNIGDKVAAVSLSWGGPGAFPHRYEVGKRQLEEEFGLRVVESRHARRDPDWLYHHPQARAEDLMEAFSDPSIRGIISTIGGDDSIRLLPHLDLGVIRANPKVLLGLPDLPIISRMDYGHTAPMFVLPYGLLAEIDCDRRRFSTLESGVSE